MDYLGDKLTVAQTHMTQWMGTVRRSLQEALNLVTAAVAHERAAGPRAPLKRTSSFRHFASRSRESFRRFSVRSQQRFSSLRKRQSSAEPPDLVSRAPWDDLGVDDPRAIWALCGVVWSAFGVRNERRAVAGKGVCSQLAGARVEIFARALAARGVCWCKVSVCHRSA